jgi:hypothetical protein
VAVLGDLLWIVQIIEFLRTSSFVSVTAGLGVFLAMGFFLRRAACERFPAPGMAFDQFALVQ